VDPRRQGSRPRAAGLTPGRRLLRSGRRSQPAAA
jgi:hypothetical protein